VDPGSATSVFRNVRPTPNCQASVLLRRPLRSAIEIEIEIETR